MISVVITTCKREFDVLRRAIDSVIAQTYSDWELIIVDDSPTNYPPRYQIAEKIRASYALPNIQYIQNEQNRGACYSRNRGLMLSKGEYIAYLDDDDEWLPDKLSLQFQAISLCSKNTALLYCPFFRVNECSTEKWVMARRRQTGKIYGDLLIHGNYIGGTSVPLIRTAHLKSINGFDEQMQSSQDYDVWLRLAQKYEISCIDKPLVNYYMHHGTQITTNPRKQIQGGELIISKNKVFIANCREAFWARTMLLTLQYAADKKPLKAIKLWVSAVIKCPMKLKPNCEYLYAIAIRMIKR